MASKHAARVLKYPSLRTFVSKSRRIAFFKTKEFMGPPDSKSNLRALKITIPKDETEAEKHYRIEREKLQLWNQKYWENHNNLFQTEKEKFIKTKLQNLENKNVRKQSLNVEEMAVFYKSFLNENHKKHVDYNWEWYRKNAYVLWLSLKAEISKIIER